MFLRRLLLVNSPFLSSYFASYVGLRLTLLAQLLESSYPGVPRSTARDIRVRLGNTFGGMHLHIGIGALQLEAYRLSIMMFALNIAVSGDIFGLMLFSSTVAFRKNDGVRFELNTPYGAGEHLLRKFAGSIVADYIAYGNGEARAFPSRACLL